MGEPDLFTGIKISPEENINGVAYGIVGFTDGKPTVGFPLNGDFPHVRCVYCGQLSNMFDSCGYCGAPRFV